MGRDSNPRWTLAHSGFQDRRLRPLGHPSKYLLCNDLRRVLFFHIQPIDTQYDTRLYLKLK